MTGALTYLTTALDSAERGARWALADDRHVGSGVRIIDGELAIMPSAMSDGLAAHFTSHDPARVLRRIKADRELLADFLAERHHVNDGDCWYTCRAATEERDGGETCNDDERGKPCDCGRDARVERRVRNMAQGWGWTGEA